MDWITHKHKYNHEFSIMPGAVGSVGQTCTQFRQKRSCPDQAHVIRYSESSGSNIVDGNNAAMYRISAGARVYDSSWQQPGFKTAYGTRLEDVRAEDRTVMPLMGQAPQWDWQNKIATAYSMQGAAFTPTNGYGPPAGSLPRGPMPQAYVVSQGQQPLPPPGPINPNPNTGSRGAV